MLGLRTAGLEVVRVLGEAAGDADGYVVAHISTGARRERVVAFRGR